MKKHYKTAQLTDLGYVGGGGEDHLVYVDIPISSTIPADLFDGVRKSLWQIVHDAVVFVKMCREEDVYRKTTQRDIKRLNKKYENLGLKHGRITVANTIYHQLRKQAERVVNISLMAQLKYHRPELFALVLEHLDTIPEECKGDRYYKILTNGSQSLLTAGAESRGGESIFDRAFHHYSVFREGSE